MLINVTFLSDYMYCARKLYLQKVMKVKVPLKAALVKGSIRHITADKINRIEEGIITSITSDKSLEKIKELYNKSYSSVLMDTILTNKEKLDEFKIDASELYHKDIKIYLEEAKTRAANVFNFIEINKIYGQELWENLTPKLLTEVHVKSEELKLKGIVDKIELYSDKAVPYEIKTGKMPDKGIWPSNKIQLVAYILMLKEKFNVEEGYVHYSDHNELRKIVFNPFHAQELIKTRDEVIEVLEKESPPKKCGNENKCVNCNLKDVCEKIK